MSNPTPSLSIRCLIVEDEPLAQDVIKTYVDRLPFLELAGTCQNALEAYETLSRQPVDLLFCDIQMPKISGIDFLKSLTARPLVIMTTAFHEYALDGFELDVVDYLMKPISFDRFLRAVNKAKDQLRLRELGQGAPVTSEPARMGTPAATSADHIFVKEDGKLVKIFLHDIRCVEGMRDYVKIHLPTRFIVTHLTMKKLEETLPSPAFIRVHKSFIVRLADVRSIEGNQLDVGLKSTVPIGQQFREDVLQAVGRTVV